MKTLLRESGFRRTHFLAKYRFVRLLETTGIPVVLKEMAGETARAIRAGDKAKSVRSLIGAAHFLGKIFASHPLGKKDLAAAIRLFLRVHSFAKRRWPSNTRNVPAGDLRHSLEMAERWYEKNKAVHGLKDK